MSKKIPVTVLTGFLGSGKTTLLNRILSEQHGMRVAVIENEFGEVGIDQELVINADEEVFQMNNGCICCTVRGDLIRILGELAERKDQFDRVILETTGMADPGPVAQTFFVDEVIREQYALDGIITLIDSKHVVQHLDDSMDEVMTQVAFADKIILNKTDLVEETERRKLHDRLKGINKVARIYSTTMANAPIEDLLDIGGFDLERAVEMKPNFLEPEYPFEWGGIWQLPVGHYQLNMAKSPDPDMSILMSKANTVSELGIRDSAEDIFAKFSNTPIKLVHGEEINKTDTCYQLQLEGRDSYHFSFEITEPTAMTLFSQHTPDEFELQLINEDDRELKPTVEHHFHVQHEHNDEVGSVSVEIPGFFNLDKINAWLNSFITIKGVDIYRMKGVIAVANEPQRIIFQGVHMSFTSQAGRPWGPQKIMSKMVFIGKDLEPSFIKLSLESCLEE